MTQSVLEVVFVLGGPASGKKTHCERIADEFKTQFTHVSVRRLLSKLVHGRANDANNTNGANHTNGANDANDANDASDSNGANDVDEAHVSSLGGRENIIACLRTGAFLPALPLANLIRDAILHRARECRVRRVLLSGFPRNQDELDAWNNVVRLNSFANVPFVLFFDCTDDVMDNRMHVRDGDAAMLLRMFRKHTMPLVLRFASRDALRQVKAGRGTLNRVYGDVKYVFDQHLRECAQGHSCKKQIVPRDAHSSSGIAAAMGITSATAQSSLRPPPAQVCVDVAAAAGTIRRSSKALSALGQEPSNVSVADADEDSPPGVQRHALPERFRKLKHSSVRKPANERELLYRTSSSSLGSHAPAEEELPRSYYGLNSKFSSKARAFGMYRSHGLNTSALDQPDNKS